MQINIKGCSGSGKGKKKKKKKRFAHFELLVLRATSTTVQFNLLNELMHGDTVSAIDNCFAESMILACFAIIFLLHSCPHLSLSLGVSESCEQTEGFAALNRDRLSRCGENKTCRITHPSWPRLSMFRFNIFSL